MYYLDLIDSIQYQVIQPLIMGDPVDLNLFKVEICIWPYDVCRVYELFYSFYLHIWWSIGVILDKQPRKRLINRVDSFIRWTVGYEV